MTVMKGNKPGASPPASLSTKLNRISERAKADPSFKFKTLAHLIDIELLRRSFRSLRKQAAPGVDGVTLSNYEQGLEANLRDLLKRLKSGSYRAQPLRRVYIEKEDGKKRPLSIPALEDKIAQRAVVEILGRIYEVDFRPSSYGYRKGRSAHNALDDIQMDITMSRVRWVLDADIKDYFGSIVRNQLMTMLQKRIQDKAILRLIGKWLNAGVIEAGRLLQDEGGTSQGSIISPLLANIYLHEVLDLWIENDVKPKLKGQIKHYRFADDFIVTFEHQDDAERFRWALGKRFAKFGLNLHEQKTTLIEFGRYPFRVHQKDGGKPKTFNFLGFTHYCGESRLGKKFIVKIKTMSKRLARGLRRVTEYCKAQRHRPLREQQQMLRAILLGHYQYYGRRTNARSIKKFYVGVKNAWRKWLGRRGRGRRMMRWNDFDKVLQHYPLPIPQMRKTNHRVQLSLF